MQLANCSHVSFCRYYYLKVFHDHCGEDRDGEDGDDRELKDNGEGAKAKEAEHGEAEQDCPVDVLNKMLLYVWEC